MVTLSIEAQVRVMIDQAERTERLARQALHFTTERDPLGQGWLVRNPKIPGTVELVSPQGHCSCRRYRLWDCCKHAALVEVRHGLAEECASCRALIAADDILDGAPAQLHCPDCIEASYEDYIPSEYPYDY